ncbi:benomyl/methotrexate resistance protein [Penicillium paradoxum]|uniref:benomyl/methotrexate resistance protein n=1 Tax=Penicillium paradoxum TaxID=176176 RepID=UPI0025467086|nr:benomyl/methotrexate resistance protein [Penicillium paradoxum]KAJ5780372.1 benomyl/methotrexate resistance protein [Penicillium paradoxum]
MLTHDTESIKSIHDPDIVDWEGEDDPAKPTNWSGKKKWTNGGLLALMTLITPLASSMFAPGVQDVMIDFKSQSSILASFVVSVYVLGYCVGPLIVAPLSEIYGRLPIYHVSNVLFVIFTIACAVSSSLDMLIVFRFFAGLAGSTPLSIGGGTFGDMFKVEERGAAIAIWSMGPLLGPVIGPVAGGFLADEAGWRWVFWLITIAVSIFSVPLVFPMSPLTDYMTKSGLMTVIMFLFLRETYEITLLSQKTERLRKATNNPNLRSAQDLGLPPKELMKRAVIRPMKLLIFSPIVLALSVYIAFVYGILYLLFTTITSVFVGTYGFSQGLSGLSYLGIGIGMMIGLVLVGGSSDLLLKKLAAANNGVIKPEYRLPPMIFAGLVLPVGLFLYGWTAEYGVQWMVPIIGTAFVGVGLIGSFIPTSTYLIDAFGIHSASAIAANTVLRSLFGALIPLAGPDMYEAMGLGWGNSLLGFLSLAMIPIPVLFWKYGEKLRTSQNLKL